jgi:hypothetical protein
VICLPDHQTFPVITLPCVRRHLPWSSLQSTGKSSTDFEEDSSMFDLVRLQRSRVELPRNSSSFTRDARPIEIKRLEAACTGDEWRENWLERDFLCGSKMKKKVSQQKLLYRWKRKVYATLMFAFCFGTFVFIQARFASIQARFNRISASLDSLKKPRLDQRPQIAFLFIARNRLPLEFVWDAFFKVYTLLFLLLL